MTCPCTSVNRKSLPLVAVGQALVIHPQQMKDGGIEVMNVHGSWRPSILAGLRIQGVAVSISNVVTVIIGAAIGDRDGYHPRHPDGEASRVMIPTIILCGQTSLTIHCSSKFPPQTTRVSSNMPRCLRSLINAADPWSISLH